MPEFLKQQEILRKQEMEKIANQRQENLEMHRKELEQQEKRFSELLETLFKKYLIYYSQDSVINSIGEFVYKPDEEVTFGAYVRRCCGADKRVDSANKLS